jgi:hypothetical protein
MFLLTAVKVAVGLVLMHIFPNTHDYRLEPVPFSLASLSVAIGLLIAVHVSRTKVSMAARLAIFIGSFLLLVIAWLPAFIPMELSDSASDISGAIFLATRAKFDTAVVVSSASGAMLACLAVCIFLHVCLRRQTLLQISRGQIAVSVIVAVVGFMANVIITRSLAVEPCFFAFDDNSTVPFACKKYGIALHTNCPVSRVVNAWVALAGAGGVSVRHAAVWSGSVLWPCWTFLSISGGAPLPTASERHQALWATALVSVFIALVLCHVLMAYRLYRFKQLGSCLFGPGTEIGAAFDGGLMGLAGVVGAAALLFVRVDWEWLARSRGAPPRTGTHHRD